MAYEDDNYNHPICHLYYNFSMLCIKTLYLPDNVPKEVVRLLLALFIKLYHYI